jgi:hypothetical protein
VCQREAYLFSRVGLRGGEGVLQDQDKRAADMQSHDDRSAEDCRNTRDYERANSSSDFTSLSLASSVA